MKCKKQRDSKRFISRESLMCCGEDISTEMDHLFRAQYASRTASSAEEETIVRSLHASLRRELAPRQ